MRIHRVEWYHHVPPHVKGILETLRAAGHHAYLVGGCVRDLWLGLVPKDFDVVSGATPEEVEKLFPRTEGVGRAFGVMLVVTEQGPVEVARFRADAEYLDGRHPTTVKFSSAEEDAKRRDFTINALFCDPLRGEVIDYVGGVEDLAARKLRCVGDAHVRFEEDSLRMLRAARFHAQLAPARFELESSLVAAVRSHASRLSLVSRERVTQELAKIFHSPNPSVGLFDLVLMDLWKGVFQCPPPPAHTHAWFDALGESYARLSNRAAGLPLFVAAGARWINGWDPLHSLVLTREAKAAMDSVPALAQKLSGYRALDKAGKKMLLGEEWIFEAMAILRISGEDALFDELDEAEEDRARWEAEGTLNPPPVLTGHDLLKAGIPAGPEIRNLLLTARRAQLNGHVSSKEEALAFLRSLH